MAKRYCVLVASTVAAIGGGCATSGSAWNESGYRQSVFGYEVKFHDANTHTLTSADWQLDNHRFDPSINDWSEKTGDDYMAIRRQDWDQDGTISASERSKEPIFDLKIVNRKNNGVIWTKAHPLLPEEADQELDVVFDNYVDSLSGNGLYAQGNLFGVEKAKVRDFTTILVSKEVTKVGASDALTGTIEIAEVDKLNQDPKSRSGVLRLVLIKIRCFTVANCRLGADSGQAAAQAAPEAGWGAGSSSPAAGTDLARWPVVDCRGKPCRARTGLLVIGYYNTPAYFAGGLPELDDLLKRVSFPDAMPLPVTRPAAVAKAPTEPALGAPKADAAGKKDAPPAEIPPPAPASAQ